MPAEYNIVNNEKLMHFEIHEGDDIAYLEYRFYKKDIAFMHTEVPEVWVVKELHQHWRNMLLNLQKNIRNQ